MILAAALFFVAPQVSAAETLDVADEVIVVGRRLKNWRGKASVNGSTVTCKTIVSTGDKEIDSIGCQALEVCLPAFQGRVDASKVKGVRSADRKKMVTALNSDLAACVRERRDVLVADLVDRRFEERQTKTNAED